MQIKTTGNITDIDDRIRIEPAHVHKKAVATEELLSDDVTARHYYAGVRKEPVYQANGEPRKDPDGNQMYSERVGVDSLGKPIKLGEEMDYIDWKGKERVYNVYQKVAVKDDEGVERMVYQKVDEFDTHDEAMSHAVTLASNGGE